MTHVFWESLVQPLEMSAGDDGQALFLVCLRFMSSFLSYRVQSLSPGPDASRWHCLLQSAVTRELSSAHHQLYKVHT